MVRIKSSRKVEYLMLARLLALRCYTSKASPIDQNLGSAVFRMLSETRLIY